MNPVIPRIIALSIAALAIIDPSFSTRSGARPVIAVVGSGPGDSVVANRVGRALARDYTVVRTPLSGARATVLVGNTLPRALGELAAPVFAVVRDSAARAITLEAVQVPAQIALSARAPVTIGSRAFGSRGGAVTYTLSANGVAIDQRVVPVTEENQRMTVPMTFVPSASGTVVLRVGASLAGEQEHASADVAINVRDTRHAVLFFDRRPSWMSTFVRRALEDDARFAVTSRVMTSRNLSTDAGKPPASLDDLTPLSVFDAIVVGAPDALTEADVAGLERYLRRRGGAVVLLAEQQNANAYSRISGAREWGSANVAVQIGTAEGPVASDSSPTLRASDIAWPAELPPGARALANVMKGAPGGAELKPVVWQSAVGAGRIVVSSALDAWTSRDASLSGFNAFWRSTIADAANATPSAIDVVAPSLMAPGEISEVRITLRDIALDDETGRAWRATVTATIESDASGAATPADTLRPWPSGMRGELRAKMRAPNTPGLYRIVISTDGARAIVPFVVAAGVARAASDDADVIRAFTASRGGAVYTVAELNALRTSLARSVRAGVDSAPWHPMRSAWWVVPFALSLGAEWWLRRRKGLA